MIFIRPDLFGHFGCGAIIGLSALWLGWIAILIVIVLAAAKELYDLFHPPHTSEWLDMGATVFGGALAVGLVELHRIYP